tara:strand:- start:1127 stop:1471 length:345 start_codon:yes stop_codon:yes gene_type:complete
MSLLYTKVKKYLEANSKTWAAEQDNIVLQNDGSGDYVHTWNVSGLAKPTDAQLSSYDTAADLEKRQDAVRATRRIAYGSVSDQLDMQYKDNINGTTTWKDHVAAVKSANPIPTE